MEAVPRTFVFARKTCIDLAAQHEQSACVILVSIALALAGVSHARKG